MQALLQQIEQQGIDCLSKKVFLSLIHQSYLPENIINILDARIAQAVNEDWPSDAYKHYQYQTADSSTRSLTFVISLSYYLNCTAEVQITRLHLYALKISSKHLDKMIFKAQERIYILIDDIKVHLADFNSELIINKFKELIHLIVEFASTEYNKALLLNLAKDIFNASPLEEDIDLFSVILFNMRSVWIFDIDFVKYVDDLLRSKFIHLTKTYKYTDLKEQVTKALSGNVDSFSLLEMLYKALNLSGDLVPSSSQSSTSSSSTIKYSEAHMLFKGHNTIDETIAPNDSNLSSQPHF